MGIKQGLGLWSVGALLIVSMTVSGAQTAFEGGTTGVLVSAVGTTTPASVTTATPAPSTTMVRSSITLNTSVTTAKQGGLIAVWVDNVPEGQEIRISASWLSSTYPAEAWEKHRTALLQVPVSAKPNTYSIRAKRITRDAKGKIVSSVEIAGTKVLVKITARKFEQQIFSVSKQLEAVRSEKNVNDDAQKVAKAKANSSLVPLWDGTFIMPIQGGVLNNFAKQRIINGKLNYIHSGADISAKRNTPILAPAAGKVVFAGPLVAAGNTVMIDHGLGMFSSLVHQEKVAAKVGQIVKPGDVVGYVGSTGFATGPHLHWTLTVHGSIVDPALLLAKDPLKVIRSEKIPLSAAD